MSAEDEAPEESAMPGDGTGERKTGPDDARAFYLEQAERCDVPSLKLLLKMRANEVVSGAQLWEDQVAADRADLVNITEEEARADLADAIAAIGKSVLEEPDGDALPTITDFEENDLFGDLINNEVAAILGADNSQFSNGRPLRESPTLFEASSVPTSLHGMRLTRQRHRKFNGKIGQKLFLEGEQQVRKRVTY